MKKYNHNKLILIMLLFFFIAVLYSSKPLLSKSHSKEDTWLEKANQRIQDIRKKPLTIKVTNSNGVPISGAEILFLMKRHEFQFGTAISVNKYTEKSKNGLIYKNLTNELFNAVTLENDLKLAHWEESKLSSTGDLYRQNKTIEVLADLRKKNINVRGHFLSWGELENNIFFNKINNKDHYKKILFDQIYEKTRKLGYFINEWDAINHPVWGRKTLDSVYGYNIYNKILKESIKHNKNIDLYVNEIGLLDSRSRSEELRNRYFRFIEKLVDEGEPITGIGMMAHFRNNTTTHPEKILSILDRFSTFKLPIKITEFDIRFGKKGEVPILSENDLQEQASFMRNFMITVFSHPAVNGITIWGFWEGHHWYPSAALYRTDWTQKPNGKVWEELIFKEWWTNEISFTGKHGTSHITGFLGDYEILIQCDSIKKKLNYKLDRNSNKIKLMLNTNVKTCSP